MNLLLSKHILNIGLQPFELALEHKKARVIYLEARACLSNVNQIFSKNKLRNFLSFIFNSSNSSSSQHKTFERERMREESRA